MLALAGDEVKSEHVTLLALVGEEVEGEHVGTCWGGGRR